MAELTVVENEGKGKKKSGVKKTSTKVDMTPMVDLGFLLITFFMLTTTLNKPQTMEITMPDRNQNKEDKMKVKESRTVTVLLGADDKVYYYQGVTDEEPEVGVTNFSSNGIRKTLLTKKREIGQVKNPKGEMEDGIIVIIKARDDSNYKNFVDILDEMNITDINVYAVVDITPADIDLMNTADGLASAGQTTG